MPRRSGGRKAIGPLTSIPSIRTRPEVGASTPAATRSSVVLPHPEWPRRHTSSPGSIVREMPSSARSDAVGVDHVLEGELRRDRGACRAALTPPREAEPIPDPGRAAPAITPPSGRSSSSLSRSGSLNISSASSGSSSAPSASASEGTGTDSPAGMRPSMNPAPLSSSRPGRSSIVSRPKCSRKAGVVP